MRKGKGVTVGGEEERKDGARGKWPPRNHNYSHKFNPSCEFTTWQFYPISKQFSHEQVEHKQSVNPINTLRELLCSGELQTLQKSVLISNKIQFLYVPV